MIHPLVSELAGDGIPVTATCRVLGNARQPYCCWLDEPVRTVEWVQAHRINALDGAHVEDPKSGYRFLGHEGK